MVSDSEAQIILDRARYMYLSGEHKFAVNIYKDTDPSTFSLIYRLRYYTEFSEVLISVGIHIKGADIWSMLEKAEEEAKELIGEEGQVQTGRALAIYSAATVLGSSHVEDNDLAKNYLKEATDALEDAVVVLGLEEGAVHRDLSRDILMASALLNICWARVSISSDSWKDALMRAERALGFAKLAKEKQISGDDMEVNHYLAEAHRVTGDVLYNSGEPGKAKGFYKRAYRAFEDVGDLGSMAMMAGAVGDCLKEEGDTEGALTWFGRARSDFEKLKIPHGVLVADMKKGLVLIDTEEYKKAFKLLNTTHKKLTKIGAREDAIMARIGALECEFKLKKHFFSKQSLINLLYEEPVKQHPKCYNYLYEVVAAQDWLKDDKDMAVMFESPVKYTITRELIDMIIAHAKQKYPNEFGAVLHGNPHIHHMEFVLDSAHGRTSVVFNLYNRFSQRRMSGDGVVHSHPSGSARPSRADVSLFGRFPGINIIIAYPFTYTSWAAYDMMGNRVKVEMVEKDPDDSPAPKKKGRTLS